MCLAQAEWMVHKVERKVYRTLCQEKKGDGILCQKKRVYGT